MRLQILTPFFVVQGMILVCYVNRKEREMTCKVCLNAQMNFGNSFEKNHVRKTAIICDNSHAFPSAFDCPSPIGSVYWANFVQTSGVPYEGRRPVIQLTREDNGYTVCAAITKQNKEEAIFIQDTKLQRKQNAEIAEGKESTVKPAYGFIAIDIIFGLQIPKYAPFDWVDDKEFLAQVKIRVENKLKRL